MARIGLVLSGGMAKGAYQIGVLRALREYLAPEDILYTSASSIGVLNAYAFLTGKLDRAGEMWRDCNPEQRNLRSIELMRSGHLYGVIDQLFDPEDRLEHSFYISLYNSTQNRLSYVDLALADPALRHDYLLGAVSVPPLNQGVNIHGERIYDGAIIDYIPVFPLVEKDLDYVLCIYFDPNHVCFECPEFDRRVAKIVLPDDTMLSSFVVLSRERIQYMLNKGYDEGQAVFRELFAHGSGDTPYILSTIGRMNQNKQNAKMRITGEILVAGFNRVTKMLTRKQAISE